MYTGLRRFQLDIRCYSFLSRSSGRFLRSFHLGFVILGKCIVIYFNTTALSLRSALVRVPLLIAFRLLRWISALFAGRARLSLQRNRRKEKRSCCVRLTGAGIIRQ